MENRPKGFGLSWRNTPFALYFMTTNLAEYRRDAPGAEAILPTQAARPPAAEGTVLECETFKLDHAKVLDLAGASGGKAVLFDSETCGAETSVPLTKGTYEVTLFIQGTDEDQDAVYLSVAGIEYRLFPEDYGKVMAVEPFTVEVAKDGAVKVVLMAAETGVYLDKVVLKKVK